MISWTDFLLLLALIYFLYYGLNLLIDLFVSRSQVAETNDAVEVFELYDQPVPIDPTLEEQIDHAQDPVSEGLLSSGALTTTGGVDLQTLFALAANDAIEFTRLIAA